MLYIAVTFLASGAYLAIVHPFPSVRSAEITPRSSTLSRHGASSCASIATQILSLTPINGVRIAWPHIKIRPKGLKGVTDNVNRTLSLLSVLCNSRRWLPVSESGFTCSVRGLQGGRALHGRSRGVDSEGDAGARKELKMNQDTKAVRRDQPEWRLDAAHGDHLLH